MTSRKMPFERKLLRRILKGETDPRRLAKLMRIPLEEVADWMSRPRTRQLIRGLGGLGESCAELRLSQRRTSVVAALEKFIESEDATETRRRACCDLLKSGAPKPSVVAEPDVVEPHVHNDRGEQRLRQAMELIGSGQLDAILHESNTI